MARRSHSRNCGQESKLELSSFRGRADQQASRDSIESGALSFLSARQSLDGEFERPGMGQKRGVAWAIGDVFTAANFEIATIAALIGYVLFEFFRKKF